MTTSGRSRSMAHYRQSDGASQTVREHLDAVSRLTSAFAGKVGIPSLGALVGLLHDLGKYSAAFQAYLEAGSASPGTGQHIGGKAARGKIDHSSKGAQLSWEALLTDQSPLLRLAGQMAALCIASHHSGLLDCIAPDGEDAFSKRMAKEVEPTSGEPDEQWIRGQLASLFASAPFGDELGRHIELLRGNERTVEVRAFMLGLLTRFLFSCLIDADRVDTADFENQDVAKARYRGEYPRWEALAARLEAHLSALGTTRRKVDRIRRGVSEACLRSAEREKGLYQLTVPTGGGKTLASLRFALHHARRHRMNRVVYVAPYTSILDQNAAVARTVLEGGDDTGGLVVLEHHSNLAPEQDTWLGRVLSEDWDAPVVFTTAVQLLDALFGSGTRGVRRMHQLANAVLILDEVQALPVRIVHPLNNAMNFLVEHCGATIVLCTATQPLLDKVDANKGAARLAANAQMVPDVGGLFRALRRVTVVNESRRGGWTAEDIAGRAREEVQRAGSALVVVNTKAEARELYRRCRGNAEHVYHLSTSMCPAHRLAVLNEIRDRLDRAPDTSVLCVSTQLIEAGIDVDFGSVIRCLAGLDSIAQAAGRCNRHGRRRAKGRVLVVNPAGENLGRLRDIRLAQEVAERVLAEYQADPSAFDCDLQSPTAMARFYQYYFFERAHEMSYPVSASEIGRDGTLLDLLSTNAQSVGAHRRAHKADPPFALCQSFAAAAEAFKAVDECTQGVIIPYGEEGRRIIADLSSSARLSRKAELLKEAQHYSVGMFPHEIAQLRATGGLHEVWEGSGVLCLVDWHYSDALGASVERIGEMRPLIG